MEHRRTWYAISIVLIAASLAGLFSRGLNLGVDFTGGVLLEYTFSGTADADRVRSALATVVDGEFQVQTFGTSRDLLLRLPPVPAGGSGDATIAHVTSALQTVDADAKLQRSEIVGASVGRELFIKGLSALGITLLLILG